MVVKSTIMPLGAGIDVMKFNPRSTQNSKSMIKSLQRQRVSGLLQADTHTSRPPAPQSPGISEVRGAVVIAAATKADDDARREEKEGVEDEEHHAQVPALAQGVLVAHDVPAGV